MDHSEEKENKWSRINKILSAPGIIAWYLFGFLLEFILELPFMIAFYLNRQRSSKK